MCGLLGGGDGQPINLDGGGGQLNIGLQLRMLGGVHKQLRLASHKLDQELVTIHLGKVKESLQFGQRASKQAHIISQADSTKHLPEEALGCGRTGSKRASKAIWVLKTPPPPHM